MSLKRAARINFSQILRTDGAGFQETSCGFAKLPFRVSRVGCMEYKDEDGKSYVEFKPPEELFNFDSMESLKCVAVTNKHPKEVFVTKKNSKKLMVGFIPEFPEIEEEYYLKAEMVITDAEIIEALEKKFMAGEDQEISAGYSAVIEDEVGEWNGEKFQAVQREIVFNHCALVDVGRAGEDVKILWPNRSDSQSAIRYASVFV